MQNSISKSMQLVSKEFPDPKSGSCPRLLNSDGWDVAIFAASGGRSRGWRWQVWLQLGLALFWLYWLVPYLEELLSLSWGQQIVVELGILPVNLRFSRRARHCCAGFLVTSVVDLR